MQYRTLGKSNLKVSALCLGTMMFGDQTDAAEAARIVADAREHGVNFIDTADVYSEGESEKLVHELFEHARRNRPTVLFFDEFDVVGKERGDVHETGEIKRVVSFLLMQLDQLPSYVIVVAATNHAELLDRAVWRRFQLRIDMPSPSTDAVAVLIDRFFNAWPEPAGMTAKQVASQMGQTSFAEVYEFCQNIRRRHILSQGGESLKSVLAQELRLWKTRIRPESDGTTDGTSTAAPGGPSNDRKKKGQRPATGA